MTNSPQVRTVPEVEAEAIPVLTLEDLFEAKENGLLSHGVVTVFAKSDLGVDLVCEVMIHRNYVRVEDEDGFMDYVFSPVRIDRRTLIPVPGFPGGRPWGVIYDEIEGYGLGWGIRRVLQAQREALLEAARCVYGKAVIMGTENEFLPLVDKDPVPGIQSDSELWVLQPYSRFMEQLPQDKGFDYSVKMVPCESVEI